MSHNEVKTSLDPKTIETVKATVPVLAEHGEAITKRFYQLLFQNHPELKNIFNQTNQKRGRQPRALANTVYAAAQHIDQLEVIEPVIIQVAHKHRSLNIKPEQYPIVGENLLFAIKDTLGDQATDDIMSAWEKAYKVIAEVFIKVEQEMYHEVSHQTGGWTGFRNFKVTRKVQESDVITSFYLKPEDHGLLPAFNPGQYITVKAEIPGEPYTHLRQYSLSDAPGQDHFRISVKREDSVGHPEGVVSNFLHKQVEEGDVLPVSAPGGDFHLDTENDKPLVLISGGVGQTPIHSMLKTVVKKQPNRPVYYIHAATNDDVHALKQEVQHIAAESSQVKTFTCYSQPNKGDQSDYVGYITLDWLKECIPSSDCEIYFCGPEGFMKHLKSVLYELNVPSQQIHYEFFGPHVDL
ncbi:NO-inducible flavohemoprotein [Piscibacillus halophilus]|uniref:NO-inducible flavohemoprotein n=1 Tax=Piscibacillus halophilus TaxID=571933 RepID=UPI00158BE67C|nr:NO-inducible flavohemoprotein [Piscibacillus halophilus]